MSSHLRGLHLWLGLGLVVFTSGVSSVTLTHEQQVRDAVAELTGGCKNMVEMNVGVFMSGPDAGWCNILEAFQTSFTGSCNKTELDKIHTAICNFSLSTTRIATSAKPTTTTQFTTPVQHAINISMFMPLAQTHRELVDYVIANISSDDCRRMIEANILNIVSGDDTTWCGKLEIYQGFLKNKCGQNYFNNFNEAVCMTFVKTPTSTTLITTNSPTPTTTTSTNTIPPIISLYLPLSESHKDLVRLIISNMSSDNCKAVVTSNIKTIFGFPESQWCFYFSSYGDEFVKICPKVDIDNIRIALCMPFTKPTSTSTPSTSPLMSALLSSTTQPVPTPSTRRLTSSAVAETSQRTTDRTPIHNVPVPFNETKLQKTLQEIGYELTTPTCKQLLEVERQTMSSFTEGCCMLESSIGLSLVPSVCTQLEYNKVYDVLCVNVTYTTTAPPGHVTDSSDYMTTGTSGTTTSTKTAVATTSTDTSAMTTSTDTSAMTTPTGTSSNAQASSITIPSRGNIFPLKLRLLFSVITNDHVTEQLEVLVN